MDEQVDLDVDNLFNDSGDLNQDSLDQILPPPDHGVLQAQSIALAPGLSGRILELTYNGCLDSIAWSRQGHVARISEDGSSVTLQCLRAATSDNVWGLSEPRPLATTFENATNLSFSPSGTDLAVVDATGRTALFSLSTISLNQLNELNIVVADQPTDLGQPVGVWWFNQSRQERQSAVVLNATRNKDRWTQVMAKARALGPLYPKAFSMINRKGLFTLFYIIPDGVYRKTSVTLPVPSASILTHAAISPTTEGKLLVVLYSFEGNLSAYNIQISWPPGNEWRTNGVDSLHPSLNVEVINHNVPILYSQFETTENSVDQSFNHSSLALTHLVIVPTSDIENNVHLPPTVWAVFASLNRALNATDPAFFQASIVRRWAVSNAERKLHPKFEEIPAKSEIESTLQNNIVMERLPDTQFPQLITSIEIIDGGQMMSISTADGRTEMWNTITMSPSSYEGQVNEVTSMSQAGLSFIPSATSVTTTVSQNACIIMTTAFDHKESLHHTSYLNQTLQVLAIQDPQQNAAVTSLILTFSRACYSNANIDDLLSCITTAYQPTSLPTIVAHLYHNIFRPVEFLHDKAPTSESGKIVSHPMVGKAFSFNLALLASASTKLQGEVMLPATWAKLWTWICINFRYITTHLFFFWREYQGPTALPDSYIDMICSICRYCLDVYRWLVSSILEIGDRATNPDLFGPPSPATQLGDSNSDGSQGLVALLLNCVWSRLLLLSPVQALRAMAEKLAGNAGPLERVVDTINRYSVRRGLNLSAVEKLLDPRWYVNSGRLPHEDRNTILDNATVAARQIEMMSTGVVGPGYQGTVKMLLDNVINSENGLRARGEIQRLKLFTDYADLDFVLLNMNRHPPFTSISPKPGTKSVGGPMPVLYDAHKKSPISLTSKQQLVRRCARCGSLSEDVGGINRDWPKKLVTYMARCVCDGYWILEPFEGSKVDGAV